MQLSTTTTRAPGGFAEVAVRNVRGELVAVIDRQCAKAAWFLVRAGQFGPRGEKFGTLKAALAAA